MNHVGRVFGLSCLLAEPALPLESRRSFKGGRHDMGPRLGGCLHLNDAGRDGWCFPAIVTMASTSSLVGCHWLFASARVVRL